MQCGETARVGLGIVVAIFRRRASANADDLHLMKG